MQLHLLLAVLLFFYALVFPVGKLVLEVSSPLFITGARMVLAGILLLGFQYLYNRQALKITLNQIWPILIIATTGIYLTNGLEFWGLQFMSAGKACFFYSFSPIMTALLSYFWFSEKITRTKYIGLSLGILGFLPLLLVNNTLEDPSGYIFFLSYAELAIIGAAFATSVGWAAMRLLVKSHQGSPVTMNAYTMLLGGILSLIHSWYAEAWDPVPVTDMGSFVVYFTLLMIISNLTAYNLHSYLLRSFTATFISFVGLIQPFLVAFLGWIILGEVVSMAFWISLIVVSVGLFIYYRDDFVQHKPLKATAPPMPTDVS